MEAKVKTLLNQFNYQLSIINYQKSWLITSYHSE